MNKSFKELTKASKGDVEKLYELILNEVDGDAKKAEEQIRIWKTEAQKNLDEGHLIFNDGIKRLGISQNLLATRETKAQETQHTYYRDLYNKGDLESQETAIKEFYSQYEDLAIEDKIKL